MKVVNCNGTEVTIIETIEDYEEVYGQPPTEEMKRISHLAAKEFFIRCKWEEDDDK